MKSPDQQSPINSTKKSVLKQPPFWPEFFIGLLLMIAAIFPPILVTCMNLFLLFISLILWAFSNRPFDQNLLRVVGPFFLIIVIGLIVGIEAERYDYWKDAWYISNPGVTISVGYVLFHYMPDLARGMRAFVIGGTLLALLHLSNFFIHPEIMSLSSVAIRDAVGTGYYAPVLAFSILFAYRGLWFEKLKLPHWLALFCVIVCTVALFASFSRTILIVAIIGVLASMGAFARREWLRVGILLLGTLLIIVTLRTIVDVDSNESSKSFIGKLARSTDELTIEEYSDFRSINLNWRGYESARAWNQYSSGNFLELLFGYGLGAKLDLGFYMRLGTDKDGGRVPLRFIPILHNGYAYLILKGGIFAIVLFGYVLVKLYLLGRMGAIESTANRATEPSRLLQAIVVVLAFTTWVVTGVFNKTDMFSFLLLAGFLLAALTCRKNF